MYENNWLRKIILKNRHKAIKLNKKEYAILVSEINTYYGKNETRPVLGKCVGDYFYVFDNLGFNNYNVFKKLKISGNEKRIKYIMEEMNSDD